MKWTRENGAKIHTNLYSTYAARWLNAESTASENEPRVSKRTRDARRETGSSGSECVWVLPSFRRQGSPSLGSRALKPVGDDALLARDCAPATDPPRELWSLSRSARSPTLCIVRCAIYSIDLICVLAQCIFSVYSLCLVFACSSYFQLFTFHNTLAFIDFFFFVLCVYICVCVLFGEGIHSYDWYFCVACKERNVHVSVWNALVFYWHRRKREESVLTESCCGFVENRFAHSLLAFGSLSFSFSLSFCSLTYVYLS